MMYIDTNAVIAYVDELDPNHDIANDLLKSLKGNKVVSKLTLVELASVYSRASLNEPLALALYSVKRVKAKIADVDFNEALTHALKLAPLLKLKTLDLLHVAICKAIGAKAFVTFDRDIVAKTNMMHKIGIEVVTKS